MLRYRVSGGKVQPSGQRLNLNFGYGWHGGTRSTLVQLAPIERGSIYIKRRAQLSASVWTRVALVLRSHPAMFDRIVQLREGCFQLLIGCRRNLLRKRLGKILPILISEDRMIGW